MTSCSDDHHFMTINFIHYLLRPLSVILLNTVLAGLWFNCIICAEIKDILCIFIIQYPITVIYFMIPISHWVLYRKNHTNIFTAVSGSIYPVSQF